MDIGYSLRQASKNSGIPITTLGNFHRKLGIIAPDVKDKKGELTLYSDAQINLAKDYYEKNIRRRGTKVTVEKNNSVDSVNESQVDKSTSIVTLDTRANKIRKLQEDVQSGIIKIGRELLEAKKEIPHGGWADWLKKEFEWTQQTANRFMRVAERFGNLNNVVQFKPSTLQAMLALPEGEEEAFIEAQATAGNPAERQSAREVQNNVKAWNKKISGRTTNKASSDKVAVEENSARKSVELSNSGVLDEQDAEIKLTLEDAIQVVNANSKKPNEVILDTYKDSMNGQFDAIEQVITETNDLQIVKTLQGYFHEFSNRIDELLLTTESRITELEHTLVESTN